MSKKRLALVAVGGTALFCVAAWLVPPMRPVRSGMPDHGDARGPRIVADRQAAPPRESTTGQPGPRDAGAVRAPPEAAASPIAKGTATEVDAPPGPTVANKDPDAPLVRRALDAYRRGDLAGGDAAAAGVSGTLARTTIAWAALRLSSRDAGLARMDAFLAAHPDWPASSWLKRRIEEAVAGSNDGVMVEGRLGREPPQTVAGKIALARAERALGHADHATAIVRKVWREDDLSGAQAGAILRDLGVLVGREDHWIRAERLLYKEDVPAALQEAALAGPDIVLLAKARAAVIAKGSSDAAIAAVPKALRTDPGLIFSRIQKARRANRIVEAADLMASAPREPEKILDGDQWWIERRLVARKLLDAGETRKAYRICADHAASSTASRIEAEFHAGWIALRFLDDPTLAGGHFARAAGLAETPISKARAAYWQGRAAEAIGHGDEARAFFAAAAQQTTSFYGQLAAAKIGLDGPALRTPVPPARGDARSEAVKVADFLFGLGARDIALPLAVDVARNEASEAQVGAMAAAVEQTRDAYATLAVGKAAAQRGMALDETAFPTFGVPRFEPLTHSAELAIVYAIARQESEFDPRSSSPAGAKGLMQMMPATAKRTADRNGIPYDDTRLSSDGAFNAQLGAAHLAALLEENGGSPILTFAAYNAGAKNVKDWIDAYGDPRKPGVDQVDWIERIPFTETRNYVQRVMENLQVYRARLGRPAPILVGVNAP